MRVLSALLLAGLTFGCGGGSISSSGGGRVTTPSAPTALVATGGNQQITLTWTASTGATSYHLKRATTSGGSYAQVGSATPTGYTDTGLTNGRRSPDFGNSSEIWLRRFYCELRAKCEVRDKALTAVLDTDASSIDVPYGQTLNGSGASLHGS